MSDETEILIKFRNTTTISKMCEKIHVWQHLNNLIKYSKNDLTIFIKSYIMILSKALIYAARHVVTMVVLVES